MKLHTPCPPGSGPLSMRCSQCAQLREAKTLVGGAYHSCARMDGRLYSSGDTHIPAHTPACRGFEPLYNVSEEEYAYPPSLLDYPTPT